LFHFFVAAFQEAASSSQLAQARRWQQHRHDTSSCQMQVKRAAEPGERPRNVEQAQPAAASKAARHSGTLGRTSEAPMSSTKAISASISVMCAAPPLLSVRRLAVRRKEGVDRSGAVMLVCMAASREKDV